MSNSADLDKKENFKNMRKMRWMIILIFVSILAMTLGLVGCGGSTSSSQETEKLKKEIEDLKKKTEDEKLAKQKEDLTKQQEDLKKEQKKLADDKKNSAQPVKAGPVFVQGELVNISIKSSFLKLRAAPNETSEVLAEGLNGDEVEIVFYDKTWCKVLFKGKEGFMATRFLVKHRD